MMMRSGLLAAALVLGGGAAFAVEPRGSHEDFKDWAENRLEMLREDFDDLDKRLENASVETREDARRRMSELKERISKTEGRLEEIEKEGSKDAGKTREQVKKEITNLREDYQDLRGDLRKKK